MLQHLNESIQPLSDFRKGSAQIIKRLRQNHSPVILTQRGRSVAVLLDIDAYEELEYVRGLRESCLRGMRDAAQGKLKTQDGVFKRLEAKLKRSKP